ncbi:MAG: extracellular solute-binding protein [Deltaproteobacteria bacterium]|nr:extracellular solute-binding protein [Deltaproteobacteria bacterium]
MENKGALESNTDELYEAIAKAARVEGTIRFYDGWTGGRLAICRSLYDFFLKKTGVEIDWYTSGPAQTPPLVWNEDYSGELRFDVMHTSDVAGVWYPLKERRRLMAYVPPEAVALRKGTSDPDGYFHFSSGTAHVPMYNPDRLTPSELPKSFKELVQPRWKNRLAIPDPNSMEPVRYLLAWMYAKYGPEYIVALAGQNPKVPLEGRAAVELVTKEEVDVLVETGAPRCVEARKKGEPIAYFVMEEGAFYKEGYVGINAQTKKPNLSKLFVRWLLSLEAQKIIVDGDFDPARTDITTPDWYFPFAKYEQEGKLLGDKSPYWVDIQQRYRHIAVKTYLDALRDTDLRIFRFQKLVDRVPGKVHGDGY